MKEKHKLLEFERGINPTLKKICEPLFQHTPITCFTHLKFLSDTDFVHMCSDVGVSELANDAPTATPFFQEFLRKTMASSKYMDFLWPVEPPQDSAMAKVKEHGVWNGMTIYKYDGSAIHAWSFAGKDGLSDIQNFYNLNKDILWNFICYFNEKYDANFKNKVYVGEYDIPMEVFSQPRTNDFINPLSTLPVKKVQVFYQGQRFDLKVKDWKIIEMLAQGYYAKEIAFVMGVSPRTTEGKISNLKNKLGIFSKSQFLKLCDENRLL